MLPSAPPALLNTFPALLVTLLNPSCALLAVSPAFSLAALAVDEAVSAAVAYRLRSRTCACRLASTREADMMV